MTNKDGNILAQQTSDEANEEFTIEPYDPFQHPIPSKVADYLAELTKLPNDKPVPFLSPITSSMLEEGALFEVGVQGFFHWLGGSAGSWSVYLGHHVWTAVDCGYNIQCVFWLCSRGYFARGLTDREASQVFLMAPDL